MFQRFQYIFIVNKTVKTYAVKRLMDFTACQPEFSRGSTFCNKFFYEEKQLNSCDFQYIQYMVHY